jgi:hypothetical protein
VKNYKILKDKDLKNMFVDGNEKTVFSKVNYKENNKIRYPMISLIVFSNPRRQTPDHLSNLLKKPLIK